jgi:hypothetical protein
MKTIMNIAKFFVLSLWLVVLVFLASLVYSGTIGDQLDKLSNYFRDHDDLSQIAESNEESKYHSGLYYLYQDTWNTPSPVISAVLSVAIPNWIDIDTIFQMETEGAGEKRQHLIRHKYYALFDVVDEHLYALAESEETKPEDSFLQKELLPRAFREHMKEERVQLPIIAINWIKQKEDSVKQDKLKNRLTDTFFVLLVLGAFGSLIFLIRDFLQQQENTRITAYAFRPFFGMLLAMAVFLLDLLSHSIISTSNIEELRVEPLYLLGFSAGLLSEQAYEIIHVKAQNVLKKYQSHEVIEPQKTAPDDSQSRTDLES